MTSGAIDSMAEDFEARFPEMTKKFNPWTHRLMGHGWSLDEEVPERVLNRLEKEYGVSRPKAICYCREYQESIIRKAIEATGLDRDPATAFAALVIDLHQLQDLEPGNRAVKYVGRIEEVTANINRHIAALLVDRPELAAVFQKKLNAACWASVVCPQAGCRLSPSSLALTCEGEDLIYCFSADKGQTNTPSSSWANDPVPVSTIVNFGSFMPLDLISALSLCKVAIPSLVNVSPPSLISTKPYSPLSR